MPPRIWVPQPAARLYRRPDADELTVRDRLVQQYGEDSVFRMEVSVLLDLMALNNMISPSEFMEVMIRKLDKLDQARRAAAGLEGDG